MNKKNIIIISIALVALIGATSFYFGGDAEEYEYIEAARGEITEEVNVTGRVRAFSEIGLAFETSGRVGGFYAEVGDRVSRGDLLAEISSTEASLRVAAARQSLRAAELELELALEGAAPEDIELREAALDTAKQNLSDVVDAAETRLANAYEEAPVLLSSAYLTAFNTFEASDDMVDKYFTKFLTDNARTAQAANREIESSVAVLKNERDALKDDFSQDNADSALKKAEEEIDSISRNLDLIIDIMEDWDAVLDSDVEDMKAEKALINTRSSELTSANTSIASIKDQNTSEINAAEGAVTSAEKELALIGASIRDKEIDIMETQVERARTELALLSSSLTSIVAPVSGVVTDIDAEVGEIAGPTTPSVSVMSDGLQVEANVPEADFAKVKLGDSAVLTLDAYGRDVLFNAEVVHVDPAATILEGVATYGVTLKFSEEDKRIRQGMTANIDIQTAKKENIILVPQRAVIRRGGGQFVRVLEGDEIVERPVETGLRGIEGNIEIVSGLEEGERVITLILD